MLRSKCPQIKKLTYESSLHSRLNNPARRRYHNRDATSTQHVKPIKSLYIDTQPPSPTHLSAATLFFRTHTPLKSWTATEWRKNQPYNSSVANGNAKGNANSDNNDHLTPEVTFLGRSNSGKSSLLNALLLNPTLCRVGPKPGKTATMHAWSLHPLPPRSKSHSTHLTTTPLLNVLDMPGYGHGSHADWGAQILKYLTSRRQLRRAFVLVNPAHGLKSGDLQILELLRHHGISHQMIACKCDHEGVGPLEAALQGLKAQLDGHGNGKGKGEAPALLTIGDILAVGGLGDGRANQNVKSSKMRGVEEVRWAVLRAAGLDGYAVALGENGGVLPKLPKLPKPPLAAAVVSRLGAKENGETGNAAQHRSDVSTREFEKADDRVASSTASKNVAVGFEEFMDMTDPSKDRLHSRTGRPQTSRQQRLSGRRRSV